MVSENTRVPLTLIAAPTLKLCCCVLFVVRSKSVMCRALPPTMLNRCVNTFAENGIWPSILIIRVPSGVTTGIPENDGVNKSPLLFLSGIRVCVSGS